MNNTDNKNINIESLKRELALARQTIAQQQLKMNQLEVELSGIIKSISWRVTKPFRELGRWVSSPKSQLRRYFIFILNRLRFLTPKQRDQFLKVFEGVIFKKNKSIVSTKKVIKSAYSDDFLRLSPSQRVNELINLISENKFEELTSNEPLVSIIIPTYGHLDSTLMLLYSMTLLREKTPFEIIIVDDCSPDKTVDVLKNLRGIKLFEKPINEGFIRACNAGAGIAKGKYLLFLNNDTEVVSGWLDSLIHTFSDFTRVGLVGSKLIYPDGQLQEAGGIIWRDGSAWNFGRMQDVSNPSFNYAREVDYCSGASIVIPKELFTSLGGFDEHYLPAYCEDSDLALKVRSAGYRVLYQPASTVIHYEGVSSGTDLNSGVKSYQVINNQKLIARWADFLSGHRQNGVEPDLEKDRNAKYRVLVVDHFLPTPNKDAGSVTAFNLLVLLREMGFQITFIAESSLAYDDLYVTNLQKIGVEVLYAPYIEGVEHHLNAAGTKYDLIFLFRPLVADKYIDLIRRICPKAKILYETADLHFLRISREANITNSEVKHLEASKFKSIEFKALLKCDQSIIRSESEMDLIHSELPEANVSLFPLMLDIKKKVTPFQERSGIMFLGSFSHSPNEDGLIFFIEHIFPIIRTKQKDIHLYVVGSNPTAKVKSYESEFITVVGFVDDLELFMQGIKLSISPLRFGAGVKGKVGTSLAQGVPAVATSISTEGMGLTSGKNILIADDPEHFANAVTDLYTNPDLWSKLSKEGLEFAEKNWGPKASWQVMQGILKKMNFKVGEYEEGVGFYRVK